MDPLLDTDRRLSGLSFGVAPECYVRRVLGHVPPRIRLDGERTAIRPLATGDAAEFAAAVAANRPHTEPWEPIHAEVHYTRAGQAETLRRDVEAWDMGTGYAFSVLDLDGDRIIGRMALGNVVRAPGRTAIGAVSLAIGVAALTLLVIVNLTFRGSVSGSVRNTGSRTTRSPAMRACRAPCRTDSIDVLPQTPQLEVV